MGNIEPAAKVVLWTESRQPLQTWTAQMRGLITSLTFPGMVLDLKGSGARLFSMEALFRYTKKPNDDNNNNEIKKSKF